MKRTRDQMENETGENQSSETTQPLPSLLVEHAPSSLLDLAQASAVSQPLDLDYRNSPLKKYRGIFEPEDNAVEGDLLEVMSSIFSSKAPILVNSVHGADNESLTVPLEPKEVIAEPEAHSSKLEPRPLENDAMQSIGDPIRSDSLNLNMLIEKVEEDFRVGPLSAVAISPSLSRVSSSGSSKEPPPEEYVAPIISVPRKLPKWMMDKKQVAELETKALEERILLKSEMSFHPDPDVVATETKPKNYKVLTELEPLLHDRVIVFDTETTGFTLSDGVLEVGAIEIRNGVRTGFMFHSLIKSPTQIHPQAFKIHGIDEAAVAGAQPPHVVLMDFLKWVNKSPLIVHNAIFDMRLMMQDLERYRLGHMLTDQPVFDTMPYYRKLQATRDYTLNDAARRYDIPVTARYQHTALVDADILGSVFLAMAREVISLKGK